MSRCRNKVSHVDANGVRRWLALDGQPLHRVTVAASELYNTRLEAHMIASLGVRFAEQARGRGKRPVREIVGMSTELMSRWSSRRAAIEARTAELAKQFQAAHGREPTIVEMLALAQQATLETRAGQTRAALAGRAAPHLAHPSRRGTRAPPDSVRCWPTPSPAPTGPEAHRESTRQWVASTPPAAVATSARRAQPGSVTTCAPKRSARSARTAWRTTAHWSSASPTPPWGTAFSCRTPASPIPSWVSPSHCAAATAPASTAATAPPSTPARRRWPPSGASCPPPVAKRSTDQRWRCRTGTGGFGGPRPHTQPRPGRPGLRDGHLRRRVALALAPAGTGKTTAMAALAPPGATAAATSSAWPPPPPRRCSRRGPRRHHRHHGQVRVVSRPRQRPRRPATSRNGSTRSAPTR